MADQQRSRDLSLVPYSSRDANGIILRHNNAVVVYDQQAQQLVLRGTPTANNVISNAECPLCHRAFREEAQEREHVRRTSSSPAVEADFVRPEYFRMLQSYQAPDAVDTTARSSSPRRRLDQAFQLLSEDVPRPTVQTPSGNGERPTSSPHGISANAFSPNYFARFFVEERVLGKGGKGVVLLVKHYLDGVFLGEFACKRVPVGDDHEWLKKVLVEVVLLQQLSHQNLVSYRHVWLEDAVLTNFGPSVPCAFILQQYCNGGDLLQYVCSPTASTTTEQRKKQLRRRSKGQVDRTGDVSRFRGLSFDEIFSFFTDITSGLSYLHLKGFVHRDLKPSNCLLHRTGSDIRVLVSDFGEAQEADKARRATGATGTISYCAPEVLREQPASGRLGEFTPKSDIFSLGMILYFMCFGRLPYRNAGNEDEEDIDQLRVEIGAWRGFEDETRARTDLPEQLYQFLKRLLSEHPADRPSADDIMRGISTSGGLGEAQQLHPTNNLGGLFEESRSGSRITPIDTPPPATPSSHWHGRNASSSAFSRPGKSKLRPTSLSRESSDVDPLRDALPNANDDSGGSNTSSLVLRKSFSTSIPASPNRALPPILPPANRTVLSRILGEAGIIVNSTVARVALLVLKMLSLQQSCSPSNVHPWVFYLLLSAAAIDVALGGVRPGVSLALTAMHFIVMYLSHRIDLLCRSH